MKVYPGLFEGNFFNSLTFFEVFTTSMFIIVSLIPMGYSQKVCMYVYIYIFTKGFYLLTHCMAEVNS